MTSQVEANLIKSSMEAIKSSNERVREILVMIDGAFPGVISRFTVHGLEDVLVQTKRIEDEANSVEKLISR